MWVKLHQLLVAGLVPFPRHTLMRIITLKKNFKSQDVFEDVFEDVEDIEDNEQREHMQSFTGGLLIGRISL